MPFPTLAPCPNFISCSLMARKPAIALEGEAFTIGRAEDNDIVVPDPRVSSHHLVLKRSQSGNFIINDLGATNPTRVNGRALHPRRTGRRRHPHARRHLRPLRGTGSSQPRPPRPRPPPPGDLPGRHPQGLRLLRPDPRLRRARSRRLRLGGVVGVPQPPRRLRISQRPGPALSLAPVRARADNTSCRPTGSRTGWWVPE
jgi:hypothetical protein